MGAAESGGGFFAEPRLLAVPPALGGDLLAAAQGDGLALREALARHFKGRLLSVDLVDRLGSPADWARWPFARWFAEASSGTAAARAQQLRPYIRNIQPPAELHRQCLAQSPLPERLDVDVTCTLFMGAASSRTRLHRDGVNNAVLVIRGAKLVVLIPREQGQELSAAEVLAINTVLCELADRALETLPCGASGTWGRTNIGNLTLQHIWLSSGMAVTIPQGLYHFVHNETPCISVTFWARPPRPPCARENTRPQATLIPVSPPLLHSQQEVPASTAVLACLSRAPVLERIVSFSFDEAVPVDIEVVACSMRAVSRAWQCAAHSDDVWSVAFMTHWGEAAAAGATPLGASWRERYSHVCRMLVREFRLKPKAALAKCGELALVDPLSAESQARFLHRHGHLLDKAQLGELFGDTRFVELLRAWTQELSAAFLGISWEAALRMYLLSVRLPGEAPKIDRLIQILAEAYCGQNQDGLLTADCAYVLGFAMLMLSADRHNPRIKVHMTPEQFLSSCRGIDGGADLPQGYLRKIFESISESPL